MALTDPIRILILACGNPLRGDDGVGPWLAAWTSERFHAEPGVRVIASQQWGPELAEPIAHSESVLFLDSSLQSPPGRVELVAVEPAAGAEPRLTHQLDAARLLALSHHLYGSLPGRALVLTVGVETVALGERLSDTVRRAIPEACRKIKETVLAQIVAQGEVKND